MIEQEILELVGESSENGERLNKIMDQFRCGRNVDDLIALLDSTNAEVVSMGAWILGEMHLELYNFDRFISRLHRLVDHKDAVVRFHAFGALYPALDRKDLATEALINKLRRDANEGVRRIADAAATQL